MWQQRENPWIDVETWLADSLREEQVDGIIGAAISELESITRTLEDNPTLEVAEENESAVWANAITVSMSIRSFLGSLKQPVGWIRKKLEDWLKKYVPKLRAAIKALARAFKALSYSISVGFPFCISADLSWLPSAP